MRLQLVIYRQHEDKFEVGSINALAPHWSAGAVATKFTGRSVFGFSSATATVRFHRFLLSLASLTGLRVQDVAENVGTLAVTGQVAPPRAYSASSFSLPVSFTSFLRLPIASSTTLSPLQICDPCMHQPRLLAILRRRPPPEGFWRDRSNLRSVELSTHDTIAFPLDALNDDVISFHIAAGDLPQDIDRSATYHNGMTMMGWLSHCAGMRGQKTRTCFPLSSLL